MRPVLAPELAPGARCAACGERDGRVLRRVELATDALVLCANDRERLSDSCFVPESASEAMLLLLDVFEG